MDFEEIKAINEKRKKIAVNGKKTKNIYIMSTYTYTYTYLTPTTRV